MILFTKEIFVQLKFCTSIYVNTSWIHYPPAAPTEVWNVAINGHVDVGSTSSYDCFSVNIQAQSREDAYRIHKELVQQVVDSGSIPELNIKLIDAVLKGEVT